MVAAVAVAGSARPRARAYELHCTAEEAADWGEEGRARRVGSRLPLSPLAPPPPPQLDPVVKAEREAGWVRLAAYERRRERERRGAEARRGEAGRKGCEPNADLSSASRRPNAALGCCAVRMPRLSAGRRGWSAASLRASDPGSRKGRAVGPPGVPSPGGRPGRCEPGGGVGVH